MITTSASAIVKKRDRKSLPHLKKTQLSESASPYLWHVWWHQIVAEYTHKFPTLISRTKSAQATSPKYTQHNKLKYLLRKPVIHRDYDSHKPGLIHVAYAADRPLVKIDKAMSMEDKGD